jgi:two-component system, cell cycle response regulator
VPHYNLMGSRPPSGRVSLPPFDSEATSITSFVKIKEEMAKVRRVSAYLIVLQGPSTGEMYKLDGPEIVLGRGSAATLRLEGEGISRRHARITQRDGACSIEDLQSANGTIINGEAIVTRGLVDGDKIRLGSDTVLKFTYHDNLDESFQQKMYEAAVRDGLTKAFNKKALLDRLETEFAYAQRHRTPLSLILFDLDFFKRVNDNFGHLAGDEALVRVSAIAQQTVRAEDFFARYGGEEFAVLSRGIVLDQGGVLADRIRVNVERTPIIYEGQRLPVTLSCGISALPSPHYRDGNQLIAGADEALYESKRAGRNRSTLHGV